MTCAPHGAESVLPFPINKCKINFNFYYCVALFVHLRMHSSLNMTNRLNSVHSLPWDRMSTLQMPKRIFVKAWMSLG